MIFNYVLLRNMMMSDCQKDEWMIIHCISHNVYKRRQQSTHIKFWWPLIRQFYSLLRKKRSILTLLVCTGKPLLIFVLMILFRSCTSPDFGVSGVLDRFQQINPKVVFSVDAVSYNMKIHDHFGKLRQVCNGIGDNLLK